MPRTILIVDDTAYCGDTLELALLNMPDLEVRNVKSATEALGLLSTTDVAALITDLQMPRIDGFELIARVRAQEQFSLLPIIVISGNADVATPERLRRLGTQAFFSKPFSPIAVRQKLEQLLYAQ